MTLHILASILYIPAIAGILNLLVHRAAFRLEGRVVFVEPWPPAEYNITETRSPPRMYTMQEH